MVKHRMLFLHGMLVPPRIYKDDILVQFLQTLEKANWEIEFLQSPRGCEDTPPKTFTAMFPDVTSDEMREWVNSQSRDSGKSKEYLGLQESLSFLKSYLEEQPRFDVIAGHSNGALMASILSLYMETSPEEGDEAWLPREKHCKGILCMNAPNSYENEVTLGPIVAKHGPIANIPSVHVFGGTSDYTYEGSQKMQRMHHPTTATIIQHEAGHFFPKEQQFYNDICQALSEMVAMK